MPRRPRCSASVIGGLGQRLRPGPVGRQPPGGLRHPRRRDRLPGHEHRGPAPPRPAGRDHGARGPQRRRQPLGVGGRGTSTSTSPTSTSRGLRGAPRPAPGLGAAQVELPAGRYEVLLPPDATADLMVAMSEAMSGRDAEEGRSPFSAPGGGTKIGAVALPAALRPRAATRTDPASSRHRFLVTGASGTDVSVFDNGLPVGPHELDRGRHAAPPALPPRRRGALGRRAVPAGRQPDARAPRRHRRRSTR